MGAETEAEKEADSLKVPKRNNLGLSSYTCYYPRIDLFMGCITRAG